MKSRRNTLVAPNHFADVGKMVGGYDDAGVPA